MGGCGVSLGEFVLSCVSGDFSAWADALTGWGSMPGACPHVYLDGAPGSFATPSLLLSCKLRANGCVTQEVIEVPPVLRHLLELCLSQPQIHPAQPGFMEGTLPQGADTG